MTDGQWLYVLAMAGADAQGDTTDQKRVATRRLSDPVPGTSSPNRHYKKAPPRKKADR